MLKTFLLFCLFVCLFAPAQAQVPQSRRTTLSQGINIDQWLHFTRKDITGLDDPNVQNPLTLAALPPSVKEKLPTDADLDYIKSLGLTHIRLPVSFNRLTTASNPGTLRPEHLADLRSVIAQITAKGLGVIVCPFNVDDQTIGSQKAWATTGYQTFWRNLAKALSQNPNNPSMVFLETCNEPNPKDGNGNDTPSLWYNVLPSIVTAMRNGESDAGITTRHTIIVDATLSNGSNQFFPITSLTQMPVLPDTTGGGNIAYNFHFYDSFDFTHQSADYFKVAQPPALPNTGDYKNYLNYLEGIPYPNTGLTDLDAAIDASLSKYTDAQIATTHAGTKAEVKNRVHASFAKEQAEFGAYGYAYNTSRLATAFERAHQWAIKNPVNQQVRDLFVTTNEFGCYRGKGTYNVASTNPLYNTYTGADPGDRAVWIEDVSKALRNKNIGWTLWEYNQGFGLRHFPSGNTDGRTASSISNVPQNIVVAFNAADYPAPGVVAQNNGQSPPDKRRFVKSHYRDSDGATDFVHASLLITPTDVTASNQIRVDYNKADNLLWIVYGFNANGTALWKSVGTPGVPNPDGTSIFWDTPWGLLNSTKTTIQTTNTVLLVKWAIKPHAVMQSSSSTPNNVWMRCTDQAGQSVGWEKRGTWTILQGIQASDDWNDNPAPVGAAMVAPNSEASGEENTAKEDDTPAKADENAPAPVGLVEPTDEATDLAPTEPSVVQMTLGADSTVVLEWSQNVESAGASFSATINGLPVAIESAQIKGQTMTFRLAEQWRTGDQVAVFIRDLPGQSSKPAAQNGVMVEAP